MNKLTFRQRLEKALLQPRQLILLDSHGRKPARSIRIRIGVALLISLAVIGVTFFTGTLFTSTGTMQSLIPQHVQLQRQYDQLRDDFAEATATNDLKDQQLESLKQELLAQQDKNGELAQRLRMFESILEARKANGIQLLNAEAGWVGKNSLRYDLTLVKGGNYPRQISGYVSLTAQSPEAETVEVMLGKQEARLPFRIETHTFLRGLATWDYDWYPDKFLATVFNHRGKELLQMEILVEGVPK